MSNRHGLFYYLRRISWFGKYFFSKHLSIKKKVLLLQSAFGEKVQVGKKERAVNT
jgi:hypothetical protein